MNKKAQYPSWFDLGMTVRDAASIVLPEHLDYEAQIAAVRNLLRRHRKADDELSAEIKEIENFARKSSGLRNQQAVDEWVDRVHNSVYQDAAHSMAAVGMLAPLVEAIFSEAFLGIRHRLFDKYGDRPPCHVRWRRYTDDEWNCHFVFNTNGKSKNVVSGILQLSEAVGLSNHLPDDIGARIRALFSYRNKMFHHGFEWPLNERRRFEEMIAEEAWPSDWFDMARSGGDPWIFYLSEMFITTCLEMIDILLEGIGDFALAYLDGKQEPNEQWHSPVELGGTAMP